MTPVQGEGTWSKGFGVLLKFGGGQNNTGTTGEKGRMVWAPREPPGLLFGDLLPVSSLVMNGLASEVNLGAA